MKKICVLFFAVLLGAGCAALSPNHYAKFVFKGKVMSPDGKPIANAWVKVRGWETLTNEKGEWVQEQVLHCGSLREHMSSYDEQDVVLVTAEGFKSSEENFKVKHPGWFYSCEPDQTVILNTQLASIETTKEEPTAVRKSKKNASEEASAPQQAPKRNETSI
jgi:hypothetical protein